jgi:hypothetical protein
MAKVIAMADGKYTYKGNDVVINNLDEVQLQNILLKLDFEKQALFDFLCSTHENPGHNVGIFGVCGGFIMSYKSTDEMF